ncbi:hypothetical protein CHARACLAT_017323 [Characodon lateralis]|uniref:Uncharacterized protein n=1 Tax=Characodon lateralis TaxID=208331 RepID=A0ABU7ELJ8_9TELE|nr:hypothetical protein [Characodon lateralis]
MGSGESTTRKVSFGVDDEDRVRILRGIKLSEDVLQRMKGVANIPPEPSPSPSSSSAPSPQTGKGASCSASSASQAQQSSQHRAQPSRKSASFSTDEQRRKSWCASPEVYGQEAGNTLDRSPVYRRETLTHTGQTTIHILIHTPKGNVERPFNLTVMFLTVGGSQSTRREPTHVRREHANSM